MKKILITGACGQIGTEAAEQFRKIYGVENVVGVDIKSPISDSGPFKEMNALDKDGLKEIIEHYQIDSILHLVAILSATGEKYPDRAWEINIESLKNILDLANQFRLRVFWPSSIAVFGAHCAQDYTPQISPLLPQTMYGITKVAGELLCSYYYKNYGVDVRSVRYPGLISHKSPPGGGTTDYAVDFFHHALNAKKCKCFLKADARLPMMYMEDAVRSIIELLRAAPEQISVRTSYNLAAFSFTPEELAAEIKKHIPDFDCYYEPDNRQKIAESWPKSINDNEARDDWGWKPKHDLSSMTTSMLENLRK